LVDGPSTSLVRPRALTVPVPHGYITEDELKKGMEVQRVHILLGRILP
jgi:hypothetical protein